MSEMENRFFFVFDCQPRCDMTGILSALAPNQEYVDKSHDPPQKCETLLAT